MKAFAVVALLFVSGSMYAKEIPKHEHPLTAQTRHEQKRDLSNVHLVGDYECSSDSVSTDCSKPSFRPRGLKINGVWFDVEANNWNGCEGAPSSMGLGRCSFKGGFPIGIDDPISPLLWSLHGKVFPKLVKFRWVDPKELDKQNSKIYLNGGTQVLAIELADGNEWWYTVESRPSSWQDDGDDPTAAEIEKAMEIQKRIEGDKAAAAKALSVSHAANRSN